MDFDATEIWPDKPAIVEFHCERSADFVCTFSFFQDTALSVPFVVSSTAFVFELRETPGDPKLAINATFAVITTNEISMTIAKADILSLLPGDYFAKVLGTIAGVERTFMKGAFIAEG
jgi:hypothetical protein